MFKNIPQKIIRLRIVIIIITLLITLILGYGIRFLKINSDITSYLKPDDPAMKLFNRIGREYGGNLMVLVAVKTDDVFTYPVLKLLKELDEKYREIKGVNSVTSLINMVDIKDTGYGIEVSNLINKEDIPNNKEELKRLKDYVMSKELYRGKIISNDGKTTIIICRLSQDANKVEVAKRIKDVSKEIKRNYKLYFTGYPMEMAEMNKFLLSDLKVLIPIVIIVIIAVLYISFRTIRGVLLPLTIVVISTVWTMGIMGYTGTELSVMSNIIPVILLGLGTAYGIHFIARYYEDITVEENKFDDIKKSIKHIGIPILLTALTTIAGFLSFLGAYITAISEFGIFTALGVLFAVILSLTFLPAVLAISKVKHGAVSTGKSHFLKEFMKLLSGFVYKNKKIIVIVTFSIFIASIFAIPNIKTQTQILDFFPKNSGIRKAEKIIDESFGGSTPIQIVIKGDIKNPAVLKTIDYVEKYLKTLPHVFNPQSISDLICEMNYIVNGHKIIPSTRDEVANLLFLLEGQDILEQMVNKDYSEAIIQATINTTESKIIHDTINKIEMILNKNLNGDYVIVKRNDLKPEAKEWVISNISEMISYDIKKYSRKNISVLEIKKILKNIYDWNGFYLDDKSINSLKNELYTYFNEESEVIIDSQKDIKYLIGQILDFAKNERANHDKIVRLMFKSIPEKWWKDSPDSVRASAGFVYQKVLNYQMSSYTTYLARNIISSVVPEERSNKILLNKISDDIYYATYNIIAVPVKIQRENAVANVNISSKLSGMIKIIERLDISLIKSQIQSIIIAIIAVFIILSIQFKSIKVGLVVLSPIVFVILLNFSIMGYTSIPLDYATMLVGSILIGVGIDYSIHFLSRFRIESRLSNNDSKNLERTLTTTGIAILINALMVALGFLVLIAGKLSILRREGWMICVLMIISAFASIVYLPSILIILKRKLKI